MTVKDLIKELLKYPPELQIVIKKDVDSSGYGYIDRIKWGCFEMNDVGNDFYDEATLPEENQCKAICLVADEQDWLTRDYPIIQTSN